jgi:hypothetical protein
LYEVKYSFKMAPQFGRVVAVASDQNASTVI